MPVRIRLSRGGAKKRPFYRIVVADSRRSRDGKFIDQIGTYNPMLPKDSTDRIKMDLDKAKEWISKGAQPSDRISIFLSKLGVMDAPTITAKTKKHLPKKKAQERLAAAKEKEEAAKTAAEEPKAEEPKAEEATPAEEPKAEEATPAEEPKAEEPKAEEATPAEEPKAEEATPAEEPKAEEPKAEEATPAEEPKDNPTEK
ncbi:30S ribosomal protein S16 [Pelagibacteraceae bacterium]|nr:30S ribosomal protein S16 [Pelagibacteraceae bacterium]